MTRRGEHKSGGETARFAAERDRRDRLVAKLSAVKRTLDEHRDDLDDVSGVAEILRLASDVQSDSDELLEDGRLLRLGIVGQIKAGKSTFLNLLLFDGREVLPSAATPMTASLTHIVPSDEVGSDRAEIVVNYYSPEEWQGIEKHAAECRKREDAGDAPGDYLRACAEQVAMADKLGIQATDHADTTTESVSIEGLNQRLCTLVGADGRFTPLVKSVKIRCGGGVTDLDIVDTPGLNDPIFSRVRKTRQLLARCDAVVLLSYAGQFMDSADTELLRRMLPAEGVTKCVLVGSKFDSALIDEAPTYHGDLHGAVEGVEGQLRKRARAEIDRMRNEDGFVSIDVLFMSAMCAILGAKPSQYLKWNAAERDVFQSLRRSYPDWFDCPEKRSDQRRHGQQPHLSLG